MEIGKQIKNFRTQMKLSQDDLALKVYVSRQTISNWENNKSYPDVKSLLLLSALFSISLDQLVKGDVIEMKEVINSEKMEQLKKDGMILSILFIATILLAVPLVMFLGLIGFGIWGIAVVVMLYYAFKVEKFKKNNDIQTYKEVLNFMDGKCLDDMEKNQEIGKRPYQKILLSVGGAAIAAIVCFALIVLFQLLGF